MNAALKD